MLELIKNAFAELDEEICMKLINRALHAGKTAREILASLNEAMQIIGEKFEMHEYTLSDLMMSGILYEEIMQIPEMNIYDNLAKDSCCGGKILLGTMKTDIHDLGKSIFKSAALISGYQVVDLGVDVSVEKFVDGVAREKPDILGISVVLTSAIEYVRKTIDTLNEKGLRDEVKIIVGGAVFDRIDIPDLGADAYSSSALEGIQVCINWMKNI